VPLFQHVLAGRRIYDLFEEGEGRKKAVNPDLMRMARLEASRPPWGDRRRGRGNMREADRERERRQRSRVWTPSRPEVIERLDAEGLLPAITFIFSRAGCESAVQQCLYAGLRLNDEEARAQVRSLVEERTRPSRPRTSTSWGTTSGWRAWSAASRPTTRACCRRSRRSSRSCSCAGW